MNRFHHNQQWSGIRMPVFPERPDVAYEMLPVWRFTAVYDGPDGDVPIPDSYMADDGVVEWEVRVKRKEAVTDAAKRSAARAFHYFGPRHLDPRFHLQHRRVGEDVPRPVSETYGDAAKDWDVVMRFRDRVLHEAGLTADSAPGDIAQAFAHEIHRNWRGGGPINHPADVLTHRSWCLGAANTTVALLESLGIPTRGVAVSDHAMCEAFVDGAWRLIDSSNHFINHEPKSVPFLPTDYMWLTTDPTNPAHGDGISDYHRGFFYHFPSPHHGIPDGRWLRESLVYYCPAYARALYPAHPQVRFKSPDPQRLVILERSYKMLHRPELAIDFEPGHVLRESVFLGDTDDVRRFEFQLRFAEHAGAYPTPESVRGLTLCIGNAIFDLSGEADWPLMPDFDNTRLLNVPLPAEVFEANAVNWMYLANRTAGSTFRIPVNIGIVEPYISPLLKDT